MLKTIGRWVIIAIVVATLWKFFGGDIGAALGAVGNFFLKIIDSVSDWLLTLPILSSLFGG